MAIVNALKFDKESGAMLCDEEYWIWRRRKTYYADNMASLVDADLADRLQVELVYGGAGNPSFHLEVMDKARKKIREIYGNKERKPGDPTTEKLGKIVISIVQQVLARRNNNALNFLYGFSTDDFIAGYFTKDDKRVEINQKSVKEKVQGIISGNKPTEALKPILDSRAVLLGYDPDDGLQMYHINVQQSVLAYVSGNFEAVGSGKYASGMSLGEYLGNIPLASRQGGIDKIEGMIELIASGISACNFFNEAGGYLNLIYIDGKGKNHAERYREIFDHRAKLASEIVLAYKKDQLERKTAFSLIDELIFHDTNLDEVEERMFKSAKNPRYLELLLYGFKDDPSLLQNL